MLLADAVTTGDGQAPAAPAPASPILLRQLGTADYAPTWQAMQAFTASRGPETPDELWLLQHPPVYTLGLAGKAEHLLQASEVPVVKIDRGGQITYHGPGQAMVYLLIDLHRRNLKVRELVRLMEQALIDVLAGWGIAAERREGAPGVYVGEAKIAALGLKISRGCSYHGLALNVDMDLSPFGRINPCGYEGLATTQVKAEVEKAENSGLAITVAQAHEQLATRLAGLLEEHYPVPGGH
ncbi:lipoyl(octanoyl) transferase LipB [Uliginosibacterium sp. H1]|uniref:lipoyl(octanoyl) transferase LipB n=1 Tax=Uliginosibacterium sp. H1 TaxID=3114757 RepID=UPI002E182598|nr:lipoyl(octanoyl) transferase LipB [Uliginosibacterium sp. H1]